MGARILGTGHAVPDRVLTNADLEEIVDTTDEWITTRTGMKERHVAADGEATSNFATSAAQRALDMAGVDAAELDMILCGTVSPDMLFPATACLVQENLGAKQAFAFDFSAGCSGFVYGLDIASQYLRTGAARKVLLIGGETLTRYIDWTDRSTCVLFGDGAAAVVLEASDDPARGVLATCLHSDGALWAAIHMPGGGSRRPANDPKIIEEGLPFIKMQGNTTFKTAVRALAGVSNEALEKAGLDYSDVRWLIPHQANQRIIEAVGQRLAIEGDRVYSNVARYGNTSAASIPIALDELNRTGQIEPGDVLLVSAFGAGLTWGAAVIRW